MLPSGDAAQGGDRGGVATDRERGVEGEPTGRLWRSGDLVEPSPLVGDLEEEKPLVGRMETIEPVSMGT